MDLQTKPSHPASLTMSYAEQDNAALSMETIMQPPTRPVSLTDGYIQSTETTITMQCHDRIFRDVDVRDQSGDVLFSVWTKPLFQSYSWRRIIRDATGTPLLHFRRDAKTLVRSKWLVERADDGRQICWMKHSKWYENSTSLDVELCNQSSGGGGDETGTRRLIEVRPKDQLGMTMMVFTDGVQVAEFFMMEVNLSRKLDRTVWKARVAPGVDLALIVALMLCRAETYHAWNK